MARPATGFTTGQRFALLALFALLVGLRLPTAWEHGRFQDEEATVFLAYAWHHGTLDAILRPFAGYLNIGATLPTAILALLVRRGALPLEYAPYFTMTTALLVQCVPASLILFGRASWLRRRWAVVAALGAAVLTPATEEVFLNVLHIQFHLALAVAAILALDVPASKAGRVACGAILFLAPLCGPAAIMLGPLFVLRALVDRDPGRWRQLVPFMAGTAAQMLLFYGASPMRGQLIGPVTLAAVAGVRLIVLPLLNFTTADMVAYAIRTGGGGALWATAALATVAFSALLVGAVRKRDAGLWLVLAALGIAGATFGYGMLADPIGLYAPWAGQRYHYLPLVLLGWGLIALAERGDRARLAYLAPLALMLQAGAVRYPFPLSDLDHGPSWAHQVALWRVDHRHNLTSWPKKWRADLSDTTRSCDTPAAPRWCEKAWTRSFHHDAKGNARGVTPPLAPATARA